jgi:uncharacterized membrane protein YkvA (DUF1232 family)
LLEKVKEKVKETTQDLSMLYIAYRRKDVPLIAKILIITAVVYGLSPIDLIPDFIPVLGCVDDILLLPLLIYASVRIIPKNILAECRAEAATIGGKYKKWYYGIPVIAIWAVIAAVIAKNIAERMAR